MVLSNVAIVARANTKALPLRFASVLSDSDLVQRFNYLRPRSKNCTTDRGPNLVTCFKAKNTPETFVAARPTILAARPIDGTPLLC
jgi:hypothetical protein